MHLASLNRNTVKAHLHLDPWTSLEEEEHDDLHLRNFKTERVHEGQSQNLFQYWPDTFLHLLAHT